MADLFGKIGNEQNVLIQSSSTGYVERTSSLPDPSSLPIGTCRLLDTYDSTRKLMAGRIYMVKLVSGVKTWVYIKDCERGVLAKPSNVWKRVTSDAIVLHWKTPASVVDATDSNNNATWKMDIIVRKSGSMPTSTTDGEIVGCSNVRDQWNDESWDTDSSNPPGFVIPLGSPDLDYHFRIFSVTITGRETGSDDIVPSWTWDEISAEIKIRHPGKAFRVGDIFEMPLCDLYPTPINAQIVDFNYNHSGENSITFMTVEVLGNKTFDNKELEYVLTNDADWKVGKPYFMKNGDSFYQFDPTKFGMNYGEHIRETYKNESGVYVALKSVLYENHPSTRYFKNNAAVPATDAAKTSQICSVCGDSNWNLSNIRAWLTSKLAGTIREGVEETEADHESWKHLPNGWCIGTLDPRNVAPASLYSAAYIKTLPLPNQFTSTEGKAFLSHLVSTPNSTILDRYNHRNIHNHPTSDSITGVTAGGVLVTNDEYFWLPSFEEVYGRKPINGINGAVTTAADNTQNSHEGHQFRLFSENKFGFNVSRRKYFMNDPIVTGPVGWYLRTCDPTTVGRVYYVPPELPDRDTGSAIETTCTAHRYTVEANGEPPKNIGPAVCFTFV